MAFVHGKDTFISIDGDDISSVTNTSTFTRTADSHDVTTYGEDNHVYVGGLGDGTCSIGGIYENTAVTGPRAVIEPLIGTNVTLIRQPEGTGSGLPQDSVDVLVVNYVETSPVADMVTWTAELQLSGAVDSTAQSA
jgi:hypothetical protein